jgi:glycosidase
MNIKGPLCGPFFMPIMKRPLRIIELSIPHATQWGTLHAAMDLPAELASSGFHVVYVLPWMKVNENQSRSPYAITDHLQLNERLGSLSDAYEWIKKCKDVGLKVVLDMPLNHTSPLHAWTSHKDWYVNDANGNMCSPKGTAWTDVVQLNHANPMVCDACDKVLRFWLEMGVDGFRFDAAAFIPDSAMRNWIDQLNKMTSDQLFLWCDGRPYYEHLNAFNGFLHHEAFQLAKEDFSQWENLVRSNSDNGIFYLTNHDTLQKGVSPKMEWPDKYHLLRSRLESSSQSMLFSWSDWKDPAGFYSFML